MLNHYQFLYEIKNLLKPHESQAERWMIWLTIVLVNNFFFALIDLIDGIMIQVQKMYENFFLMSFRVGLRPLG